jgi:hypothetical protein
MVCTSSKRQKSIIRELSDARGEAILFIKNYFSILFCEKGKEVASAAEPCQLK